VGWSFSVTFIQPPVLPVSFIQPSLFSFIQPSVFEGQWFAFAKFN
jgi:hypothetical protein